MRSATDRAWDVLAGWFDAASAEELGAVVDGRVPPKLSRVARILGKETLCDAAFGPLARALAGARRT